MLPDDGMAAIVHAIRTARESVRVTIFRSDLPEVEKALGDSVRRGVRVHALIAHVAREGGKLLRKLELRLLGEGVTVSRTADDLLRYHDKMLIVDERALYVLGFNFTRLDGRSRSMGLVTERTELVAEAVRLFEADALRQPFEPATDSLLVSPANARVQLAELLRSAERNLWIYDPRLLDRQMLSILHERAGAGVDVRVIGRTSAAGARLPVATLPTRLHLRAALVDEARLFLGSQSLRVAELDRRREVGVVTDDGDAIGRYAELFRADWKSAERAKSEVVAESLPDEPAPDEAPVAEAAP